MERIPLSSPDITDAERTAVMRVLSGTQLCFGPELSGFEQEFARYIGVDDAVAVSSGTAALHLALVALGIGAGDEVVIPSFAFVALANVVVQVGARPVFAEIDETTLNITAATVEAALTPRTRAVIVVHTFGVPAEMVELRAVCQRQGLKLIEDACEAIGATVGEKKAGSFGDAAVFGFYPNKQITMGEGGLVTARGINVCARLRRLRNQGRGEGDGWLGQSEAGFNYRVSDINCALGRVQLSRIDEILRLRREAAERYLYLLSKVDGVRLPVMELQGASISWFVYVVRVDEAWRNKIIDALAREGIATSKYFAPIHWTKMWRSDVKLPVTERVAGQVLALPFFNQITKAQQERVAVALARAFGGR
jgi:perosamine synthetase